MTQSRPSDSRNGLVDWPDGKDWRCDACSAVVPDEQPLSHACGGTLERVVRAYFWPGGRNDVVVEYAEPAARS